MGATYVYYDNKGILKEIISSFPARKGSSDYAVYLIFEDLKDTEPSNGTPSPLAKLKLPDGTSGSATGSWVWETIPFDENRALRNLKYYQSYAMYKLSISSLAQSGLWQITPNLRSSAYGDFMLYVADNVNEADGSVSFADYTALQKMVNDLRAELVDFRDNGDGTVTFLKGGN